MSKREKQIYRRGQADMLKMMFGIMVFGTMILAMFGQAFMF